MTAAATRLLGDTKSLDELFSLSSLGLPHAGMALAVVDSDGPLELLTHGVTDFDSGKPVDADTLFNIGSCSKAFAATLLQVLACDQVVDLCDPIQRYVPDFAVQDPWISSRATIHDALIHRVGVAELFFLRMVAKDRRDFVSRYRVAAETTGFRNRFEYNNSLYIILAHLTEEVTRQEWAVDLRDRLLAPLQMSRTSGDVPLEAGNLALPHMLTEAGRAIRQISLQYHSAMSGISGPSGGVFLTATDFGAWLRFHLRTARGLDTAGLPEATRLASLHDPKILTGPPPFPVNDDRSQLQAELGNSYAYGWRCGHYRGMRVIHHTGGTPGYRAVATLVPDANLAFGIVCNSDSLNPSALNGELLERALGSQHRLWESEFLSRSYHAAAEASKSDAGLSGLSAIVGDFVSTIYGSLTIVADQGSHLTARLGHMNLCLEPEELDRFSAYLRNDWRGPLSPVGPLRFDAERNSDGAIEYIRIGHRGEPENDSTDMIFRCEGGSQ